MYEYKLDINQLNPLRSSTHNNINKETFPNNIKLVNKTPYIPFIDNNGNTIYKQNLVENNPYNSGWQNWKSDRWNNSRNTFFSNNVESIEIWELLISRGNSNNLIYPWTLFFNPIKIYLRVNKTNNFYDWFYNYECVTPIGGTDDNNTININYTPINHCAFSVDDVEEFTNFENNNTSDKEDFQNYELDHHHIMYLKLPNIEDNDRFNGEKFVVKWDNNNDTRSYTLQPISNLSCLPFYIQNKLINITPEDTRDYTGEQIDPNIHTYQLSLQEYNKEPLVLNCTFNIQERTRTWSSINEELSQDILQNIYLEDFFPGTVPSGNNQRDNNGDKYVIWDGDNYNTPDEFYLNLPIIDGVNSDNSKQIFLKWKADTSEYEGIAYYDPNSNNRELKYKFYTKSCSVRDNNNICYSIPTSVTEPVSNFTQKFETVWTLDIIDVSNNEIIKSIHHIPVIQQNKREEHLAEQQRLRDEQQRIENEFQQVSDENKHKRSLERGIQQLYEQTNGRGFNCQQDNDVCSSGYKLRIPMNETNFWECGLQCPGGNLVDSGCNCACVREDQCSTEPPQTNNNNQNETDNTQEYDNCQSNHSISK